MFLVAVAVSIHPASATAVFVANPSFESPVLIDGQSLSSGVAGWDAAQIYNPQGNQFAGSNGASGPLPAPADGSQTAYAYDGLEQQILRGIDGTLGTGDDPLLTPNTTYTLTIAVGHRGDFAYGGYQMQLFAYDPNTTTLTSIASQSNVITAPAAGTFADAQLTVNSNTVNPSLLGQNLAIQFSHTTGGLGTVTDFDNVRFEASTAPEPSSMALVAGAVFLRLAYCRIKKRA